MPVVSNLLIHQAHGTTQPGTINEPSSQELLTVSGSNASTAITVNSRAVVQAIENLATYNASNKTVQRHNIANAAGERIRACELAVKLHDGTDGAEAGHVEIWLTRSSDGAVTQICDVYPTHINLPSGTADPTVGIQAGSLFYRSDLGKARLRVAAGWETITSV